MRKFISTIIVRGFCGKPNVMNLIKEICNPKIRQQIPSSKLLVRFFLHCTKLKEAYNFVTVMKFHETNKFIRQLLGII